MSQNFVGDILGAFADAFEPLERGVASLDDFCALVAEFGWTLDSNADFGPIGAAFKPIAEALGDVKKAVDAVRALPADAKAEDWGNVVPPLLEALIATITAIRSLEQSGFKLPPPTPLDKPEFWAEFAEEVLEWILYTYVEHHKDILFGLLYFLGVFSQEWVTPKIPFRGRYLRRRINWNRLPQVVTAPKALFQDVYGWGAKFDYKTFTANIATLFGAFGLPVHILPPSDQLLDKYYDAKASIRKDIRLARAPVYSAVVSGGGATSHLEVAFGVMPVPPFGNKTADPTGFSIFPMIAGSAAATFDLVDGLKLEIGGGFESDGAIRLEVRPDRVDIVLSKDLGASIDAHAGLNGEPPKPWILLGSENSTRLELAKCHLALGAKGPLGALDSPDAFKNLEYTVEVGLDKLTFVLDMGQGDGFLQKILGGKPQSLELGLSAGWSSKTGFHFHGQAQLEVALPVHLSLAGVVNVDTVFVSIKGETDTKSVAFVVSASGGLSIGPFAATVDRIGVKMDLKALDKKVDKPGTLGDLDLKFGFKPPSGVGLSLSGTAISGGGFLAYYEEDESYAGILDLQLLNEIGITAIGLVSTRMPDGSKGFALLISIGVTFTPSIQLGYGFAIGGVGGLLAVNRTLSVDALHAGLKQHSIESVMFPHDPVKNANKIISDMRTLFPIQEGRFVFGPMVKITWGGKLLEANIGIFIEVPEPVRIVLLGDIRIALPTADNAIVDLRIDVMGVLDFAKKLLSIDATLYGSHILTYPLCGDVALRLGWDENAQFAFSMGGFHPAFTPPPGFPPLDRLTLDLSSGKNLQLTCKAYQAITSNSLQFGARVDLHAEACGATLDGDLIFDALLYFSPFHFTIDMAADMSVKFHGHSLASVHLSLSLSGPTPWHARGKASFSILWWNVDVNFDTQWGDEHKATLPTVDAWALLQKELDEQHVWTAQLPPRRAMYETLKDLAADEKAVVLHPIGAVQLRQKLLPFDLDLQKVGNAPVVGHNKFKLSYLKIGDGSNAIDLQAQPVTDHFARGQYQDLTQQEKLSRPSFEDLSAGLGATSTAFTVTGAPDSCKVIYRSIVYGEPEPPPPAEGHVNWSVGQHSVKSAAVHRARVGSPHGKYAAHGSSPKVKVAEKAYQVVTAANHQPISAKEIPGNDAGMPRAKADAALVAYKVKKRGARVMVVATHEAAEGNK